MEGSIVAKTKIWRVGLMGVMADAVMQGTSIITGNLQANFTNCIFWGAYGNVTDEVMVSRQGTSPFAVNFTNCLWKVQTIPSNISATAMLANMDPLFDSVNNSNNYYDFHLRAGSPALGKGASAGVTGDLDGNPRPAVSPDLGCYQR